MDTVNTIGYRNNNPTNIRYNEKNKWRGMIGQEKGFCKFKSMTFGLRATMKILDNYGKRGVDTIEEIIKQWAPPSENDTEAYIKFIEQHTSLHRNDVLFMCNKNDVTSLVYAMALKEIGIRLSPQHLSNAYDLWLNEHIDHSSSDTQPWLNV